MGSFQSEMILLFFDITYVINALNNQHVLKLQVFFFNRKLTKFRNAKVYFRFFQCIFFGLKITTSAN